MVVARLLHWWPSQAPGPTGPEAPAEVQALVTKAMNLALFVVLAVAFVMALWGAGSMAYAKKKQQFGGVNDGQQTMVLAVGGAALTTVIRGIFLFFGV